MKKEQYVCERDRERRIEQERGRTMGLKHEPAHGETRHKTEKSNQSVAAVEAEATVATCCILNSFNLLVEQNG